MMNQIRPELRPYVIPFGSLFIILVLFVLGGSLILNKINDIRAESSRTTREIENLEQKLEAISAVQQDVSFKDFVNTTLFALPDSNPSLLLTAQFRSASDFSGATIEGFSINAASAKQDGDIKEVIVNVSVVGTYDQVSDFISDIASSLPILNLTDLKLSSNGVIVEADIQAVSFSSALPASLPSVIEALNGLSPQEIETFESISQFSIPLLNPLPAPQEPFTRQNPFSPSSSAPVLEELNLETPIATEEADLL